jgi:hypothetical protein
MLDNRKAGTSGSPLRVNQDDQRSPALTWQDSVVLPGSDRAACPFMDASVGNAFTTTVLLISRSFAGGDPEPKMLRAAPAIVFLTRRLEGRGMRSDAAGAASSRSAMCNSPTEIV